MTYMLKHITANQKMKPGLFVLIWTAVSLITSVFTLNV